METITREQLVEHGRRIIKEIFLREDEIQAVHTKHDAALLELKKQHDAFVIMVDLLHYDDWWEQTDERK